MTQNTSSDFTLLMRRKRRASVRTRLIEQAKYFGVSVPQVIEIGLDAKRFVDAKLSEPFTVVTRLAGGLGRSRVQRIYGFVRTKEGDLGEQLVANGLARIHGTRPPIARRLRISADEREKLAQLENEAKRRQVGGWGMTGQTIEWDKFRSRKDVA